MTDDITKLIQELQKPIAFAGGFASKLFNVDLDQRPLKDWLAKQGVTVKSEPTPPPSSNGGNGPQSIDIE